MAMFNRNQDDRFYGLSQSKKNPVRVIAVTSGKGGVGKTNIAINLAIALSKAGKKVAIMDADMGLANVDLLLGLSPRQNLSHVIDGECSLMDIIVDGPHGIKIIPASSGVKRMAEITDAQRAGLIHAFESVDIDIDYMIVDTGAGISGNVTTFSMAANEIIVVVTDEPTSIADAYAIIKVLHRDFGASRFNVVCNMVKSHHHGEMLFERIELVCDKYLNVTLNRIGIIPLDDNIKKSVQAQKPVVDAFPTTQSSMQFYAMAKRVGALPMVSGVGGGLEFFAERWLSI